MGDSNSSGIKGILLAIIALLLASNTYFFCKSREVQTQNTAYINKLHTSDSLRNVLNDEYNEAMNQVAYYKGENQKLDSTLNIRSVEMANIKSKFDKLMNNKNLTAKELAEAKKIIEELKSNKEAMLAEITRLKKENTVLTVQRDSLGNELTVKKEELNTEKLLTQTLTNEKSQLDLEKKALAAKVAAGSIIRIDNMSIKGVKYSGSGKEKETGKAGSVDRIKVCFDAMDNKVVDKGKESFYLRLIGPDGVTLNVRAMGSGEFTNKETNEKTLYTCTKDIDYDNSLQNVCMLWEQDTPFKAGDYVAEVYNKGFLVGTAKFSLRKGLF